MRGGIGGARLVDVHRAGDSADDNDRPGLMKHLINHEVNVLSIKESVNSLEDIFMKVTKGQVN